MSRVCVLLCVEMYTWYRYVLVVLPIYASCWPVWRTKTNWRCIIKKQNNNRAAVRQCSRMCGSKGQRSAAVGTVVIPSISGRPVF